MIVSLVMLCIGHLQYCDADLAGVRCEVVGEKGFVFVLCGFNSVK